MCSNGYDNVHGNNAVTLIDYGDGNAFLNGNSNAYGGSNNTVTANDILAKRAWK